MGGAIQRSFYVRNTSRIIVVSHQLKRAFVDKGYPADHIEVIYNGMSPGFFEMADMSKTEELRRRFDIAENEVVVGCISRLKNQEQLVRAAKHLRPDISIMFVGIEKGIFDDLAKRIGLPNRIIYAGIVPREEVVDYYRLFDVFVLPSTMDGFGLVLMEAAGLGVPVIGTRSHGIIDVLDNQRNGLWFEDGDVEGLARKIESIIEDSTIRERLISNGLDAAHNIFTMKKTIDNHEAFFMRLMREG
jgi:glycosyltransferase involved in cell wall biosynthesis